MKRLAIISLAAALCVCFLTGSSQAATYDFTDIAEYGAAYGQHFFDPAHDPLTLTALPDDALLFQDGTDGIGILSGEPDEINKGEWLSVQFDRTTRVASIFITDLFYEGSPRYKEEGWYQTRVGDTWSDKVWFEALESQTPSPASNGELTLTLNLAVDEIKFGVALDQCKSEFSVAGMETVPVPGAVWLLGSGLLGLVGLRRRFAN